MAADEGPQFRLLLVEDDERLGAVTASNLEAFGHCVMRVTDGRKALAAALGGPFDAVILDLMLPNVSGFEVCRALRARSSVPILVLTALDGEDDRVRGLDLGADDYLTKPFSLRELMARVRAMVRRARGASGPPLETLEVGDLRLVPRDFLATKAGRPLELTTAEFLLLRALAERPDQVLSREQLVTLTKGSADEAFERSIDVHISRLRRKLGDDPRHPRLLRTVRNSGYVLASTGGEP